MPNYSANCQSQPGDVSLPATFTLSNSTSPLTVSFPDFPIPEEGDWNLTVNIATASQFPVTALIEVIQDQSGSVVIASRTVTLTNAATDYSVTVTSAAQDNIEFGLCTVSGLSIRVTPTSECCSWLRDTLHGTWTYTTDATGCPTGPNNVEVNFVYDEGSNTWQSGSFTFGLATVEAHLTCDPTADNGHKLTLHVTTNTCSGVLDDTGPDSGTCSPLDYSFFILGFFTDGPGACCPGSTGTTATCEVTA